MYLTVKEASDLTGKSPTTIYRLCNKRRNSLYVKKEDNKFLINKEFLLATYPPEEKRISHEIEHGSKELGEPVFLEIERKPEEKTELVPEEKAFTIENTEIVVLNEELLETIPDEPQIAMDQELTETQTLQETEAVPFYKTSLFTEQLIGFSVTIVALVGLLLLFYYFAK